MAFTFGTPNTTLSSSFGTSAKPFSFGATTTTTASTNIFGGFSTSSAPTGFGIGTATTSSAFGGGTVGTGSTFGTNVPFGTGTSTFGAGTSTFGAGTSTFGAGTSTFGTGTSTFGAGTTFGTNTFSAPTFGTGSTFGSTFNTKPATTGFGGFGTNIGGTNTFGLQTQQVQQQQQGPTTAEEALELAVSNCSVFGDERDQILAKWNLIQARWGVGQAYYNKNAPPLELNEHNPLCRFKAVGYSRLSERTDKDGHVALFFNKPEKEIKNNQQALITSLSSLLGNKPHLVVNIDSVQEVSENKSQVVMYVVDKGAGGACVGAGELASFLSGAGPRAQLTGAGCASVASVARPADHVVAHILSTPPPGMDKRLWKQAQIDNPDPENYIPVPIIGFSEIRARARRQSAESAVQAAWLRRAAAELAELRTRRAAAAARRRALAASLHALRHTLLQVIGRRECGGRGCAVLSAGEEAERARLQCLGAALDAPPIHCGRLNELLCAVRLQRSASAGAHHEQYQLDPGAQEDLKQYLSLQQRGTAHLMETARADIAALDTIAEGMAKLVTAPTT